MTYLCVSVGGGQDDLMESVVPNKLRKPPLFIDQHNCPFRDTQMHTLSSKHDLYFR